MFPIRDTVPSERTPVVTWTLIGINAVVFLFTVTLEEGQLRQLFFVAGIVPARWSDPVWSQSVGLPALGILPFFTTMFLHGGFLHLLSNMWTLWIFGDNVEDRMGHGRFLLFYLLAGLLAGGVHTVTNLESTIPTIGASGAIAGVLGAYLMMYPRALVLTLIPICFYPLFVELPALVYLGFWFVTQILNGTMSTAAGAVGGVAWWAHIGGFLAGLAIYRGFVVHRPRLDVHRDPESGRPVIVIDEPPPHVVRRDPASGRPIIVPGDDFARDPWRRRGPGR